jgi:hypothetical protein
MTSLTQRMHKDMEALLTTNNHEPFIQIFLCSCMFVYAACYSLTDIHTDTRQIVTVHTTDHTDIQTHVR